jgi:DNA-directed RNA polymerase subunit RPC12/RpoP
MAASDEITCPMCGFKNPADAGRCSSCGAKVEALVASYSDEEVHARRYQQEDFEWKWALMASGVYLVLQALILAGLPLVIRAFDPQGLDGLLISVLVWFLGGIAVGVISPGKTFVEPAVGALIAVLPTLSYVSLTTPDGFQPTLLAYIVCAMLGVMIALFGAFLGEKIQMSTRGHAT